MQTIVRRTIKTIRREMASLENVILVIDGKTGSGKSTLAEKIAALFDADIIHMDDFFLPDRLRSKTRMEEPGGNIHYERFKTDVIEHLDEDVIAYRPFDCRDQTYGDFVYVKNKGVLIVEGSYALHPFFGDYADVSVFLDMDDDLQRRRILYRNGEEGAGMFFDKWIGLENRYFNHFRIKEKSDLTFTIER